MTWWDLTSIWSNPTVSNRLFVITQHCWIRALFCGIKLLEIDLMSKNCSVVRKFQIFSGLLTILEENRIARVCLHEFVIGSKLKHLQSFGWCLCFLRCLTDIRFMYRFSFNFYLKPTLAAPRFEKVIAIDFCCGVGTSNTKRDFN